MLQFRTSYYGIGGFAPGNKPPVLRTSYYGIGDGLGKLQSDTQAGGRGRGDFACRQARDSAGKSIWVCEEPAAQRASGQFMRLQVALAAFSRAAGVSDADPGLADGVLGTKTAIAAQFAAQYFSAFQQPFIEASVNEADAIGIIARSGEGDRIFMVAQNADDFASYVERWTNALAAADSGAADDAERGAADAIRPGAGGGTATQRNAFWYQSSQVQVAKKAADAQARAVEEAKEQIAQQLAATLEQAARDRAAAVTDAERAQADADAARARAEADLQTARAEAAAANEARIAAETESARLRQEELDRLAREQEREDLPPVVAPSKTPWGWIFAGLGIATAGAGGYAWHRSRKSSGMG